MSQWKFLLLLPALAGCAGRSPFVADLDRMHPGAQQMMRSADNGQPLLVLGAGVPYQGCLLTARTAYGSDDAGRADPCAVTMATLTGTPSHLAAK